MLSGQDNITLDDTGRIALPRRLRDALGDRVVLTFGPNSCLWLFTMEQWKVQEEVIIRTTNPFSKNARLMRQYLIGSKEELTIDKQGRILIPPPLREHAELTKECKIFGQVEYWEIWSVDRYKAYLEASKSDLDAGFEELGAEIERRKQGNG